MEPEVAKAIENINNRIASLEFKIFSITDELLKLSGALKAKKTPGLGIPVWESYREAYVNRYGFEPPRNAKTNRACSDIAGRIGSDAPAVAKFYVQQNDSLWMRQHHPIGTLLQNCEGIFAMWKNGKVITSTDSRKIEQRSSNMNASNQFLAEKYRGSK